MNCQNKREEKYERWNELLQNYSYKYHSFFRSYLDELEGRVGKEGNTPEGLKRLERAYILVKNAENMALSIDSLIQEINKNNYKSLDKFLFGENKDGKVYQIQNKILVYKKRLIKDFKDINFIEDDTAYIAKGNTKTQAYQKTPYVKLDFIEAKFAQVTKNEVLNALQKLQLEIKEVGAEILMKLGFRGYSESGFNQERVMALADTVVSGFDYQAIIGFNTNFRARPIHFIKVNGSDVIHLKNGYKLQFTTSSEGEKSWQAQIKCKNSYTLNDSIFSFSHNYFVSPKKAN
jgi:hypothetical protein